MGERSAELGDVVSATIAAHQYGGEWVRYNTPTAACVCRCGVEYEPSHLHEHQASAVVEQVGAVWEFAQQFARGSGDSPACTCVSCRAVRAVTMSLPPESLGPGDA